jgi:5'-nucleotidase
MRILISNDDGYNAHGIKILEKLAHEITDDVWVVAPDLNQSGVSQALTLRNPLRIKEVSQHRYMISGTPTDCIHVALCHLLKDKKPDLVLSGINLGANVAEDISYSGTVSVAMAATLMGVPSISMSMAFHPDHPVKWSTAEHHALSIIKKIISQGIPENILMNINFPDVISSSVKGALFTEQGIRPPLNHLAEGIDPRGKKYYWIGPANHDYEGHMEGSDLWAIANGYISLTPLSINRTHYPTLQKFQKDV